jgi:hypothetical protein
VVKLSRALQVSTDDILGENPAPTPLKGGRRFAWRLQRIQELPAAQKKAVLKLLDGALGIAGPVAQP